MAGVALYTVRPAAMPPASVCVRVQGAHPRAPRGARLSKPPPARSCNRRPHHAPSRSFESLGLSPGRDGLHGDEAEVGYASLRMGLKAAAARP